MEPFIKRILNYCLSAFYHIFPLTSPHLPKHSSRFPLATTNRRESSQLTCGLNKFKLLDGRIVIGCTLNRRNTSLTNFDVNWSPKSMLPLSFPTPSELIFQKKKERNISMQSMLLYEHENLWLFSFFIITI